MADERQPRERKHRVPRGSGLAGWRGRPPGLLPVVGGVDFAGIGLACIYIGLAAATAVAGCITDPRRHN